MQQNPLAGIEDPQQQQQLQQQIQQQQQQQPQGAEGGVDNGIQNVQTGAQRLMDVMRELINTMTYRSVSKL